MKLRLASSLLFIALRIGILSAAAVEPTAPPPFRFAEATIDQLQAQMAAGTLTSHELTAAYLERIAQIDKAGPRLNAVIELNPDALAISDRLDAERKAGKVRGPLHGIPVLVKDNIATADKMETTAGSLALVGAKPLRDATIATRLREAGAVIIGKTNPSEWANWRSTASISGWSGRGGQTRNPFALDRSPDGSSSGSAAAVSANLCVVAVGTETDGSILAPAAACGVVGLKPTVGLVSRMGIIPISASQDTAGPMARTMRDAALLLGVLAAPDSHDAATQTRPAGGAGDFTAVPNPGALRGTRLGILHGPFGFPARMSVEEGVVASLRGAGAEIVDLGELPSLRQLSEPENVVLLSEFKAGINAWLAELGPAAPVKTLAELIAFNEAHRAQEMPYFGQELFIQAQTMGPPTDPDCRDARAACLRISRTEGIDALLQRHRLDAVVALTNGPAWPIDPVNGDQAWTGNSASLAAVAGYPSVTVPATDVHGLPIGLSFVGPAWSEARLLSLAADFEALTRARREPRFLPTLILASRAAGLRLVPVTTPPPLFDGITISEPLSFEKADGLDDTWAPCLSIDTPEGLVVVVGCSHPGILPILEQVKRQTGRPLYFVIGGFHLMGHRMTEVRRIATAMQALGVAYVGATHCTGTVASHIFHTVFGDRYVDTDVGIVVSVPFGTRKP